MWIAGSTRNRCCKRIHEKRCRLPGFKRRRGRWRSEEAEEERAGESQREEETVSVLQDRVIVPDITAYHRSPRVRTRAGTFEPLLTDLLVGFFGGFFLIKKTLPLPHPPSLPTKHCFYRLCWPCLVDRDSFWRRLKINSLSNFLSIDIKKKKTFNMCFK